MNYKAFGHCGKGPGSVDICLGVLESKRTMDDDSRALGTLVLLPYE